MADPVVDLTADILDDANVYEIIESAVVRPRIKYKASTAILCRAGSDLGATMTGHHDFQLADDVIHKVHVGHYTFYSVAVVKNDKLLIKANGVYATRYVSGEQENYELVNFYRKKTGAPAAYGKLPQWVIVSLFTKNQRADVGPWVGREVIANLGCVIGKGDDTESKNPEDMWHATVRKNTGGDGEERQGLFGENDTDGAVLVQGTHIGVFKGRNEAGSVNDSRVCRSFVNPYGFGPYTYQGCKHGREGKGEPLCKEHTADNIAQYTVTANALIREIAMAAAKAGGG